MFGSKEYELAVAMINLSHAYERMVKASRQLDDMDLSELYPFYLLDFEEIQPAVKQWCMFHAGRILDHVPDQVPNAACDSCPYLKAGLDSDGMCKGQKTTGCRLFPIQFFDMYASLSYLKQHGINVPENTPPGQIQMYYVREVERVNAEAVRAQEAEPQPS